jgi:hypothetical protein
MCPSKTQNLLSQELWAWLVKPVQKGGEKIPCENESAKNTAPIMRTKTLKRFMVYLLSYVLFSVAQKSKWHGSHTAFADFFQDFVMAEVLAYQDVSLISICSRY